MIHFIAFNTLDWFPCESGWAEPGGDSADHSTSTQGAETVPAASSEERGGVPAAGQGKMGKHVNKVIIYEGHVQALSFWG